MKANPCSRCGHEPHVYPNLLTDGPDRWMVKCVFCGLQSTAKRKRSAIRQWNRIVAPPLTPMERIALSLGNSLAEIADKAAISFQAYAEALADALGGGSENE